MKANELQAELEKRCFRFKWSVVESTRLGELEIFAWFDAPDGTIKASMYVEAKRAQELLECGWITDSVSSTVAWELVNAPRHPEKASLSFLYKTIGSRRWLDGLTDGERSLLKRDIKPVIIEFLK